MLFDLAGSTEVNFQILHENRKKKKNNPQEEMSMMCTWNAIEPKWNVLLTRLV